MRKTDFNKAERAARAKRDVLGGHLAKFLMHLEKQR